MLKDIQKLYDEKLKYNCGYYEIKSQVHSDLLIVFLGTSDFIITNNFYGVVAFGHRSFDFDKTTAIYTYQLIEKSVYISRLEKLMRLYEAKRLKINRVEIVRESENGQQ